MVHHAHRPQASARMLEAARDLEVGDVRFVLLRGHIHRRLERTRPYDLALSVELARGNLLGLKQQTRELKVLPSRPVLGIRTQPSLVCPRRSLEDQPAYGVAVREIVLGARLGVDRFRTNLPHLPPPSVVTDELPHRHRPLRIARARAQRSCAISRADQSARNVFTGSTRVPRNAGAKLAATATRTNITGTATYVSGSDVLTP